MKYKISLTTRDSLWGTCETFIVIAEKDDFPYRKVIKHIYEKEIDSYYFYRDKKAYYYPRTRVCINISPIEEKE